MKFKNLLTGVLAAAMLATAAAGCAPTPEGGGNDAPYADPSTPNTTVAETYFLKTVFTSMYGRRIRFKKTSPFSFTYTAEHTIRAEALRRFSTARTLRKRTLYM